MSFTENLIFKTNIYDAFTNYIKPKAILFRDTYKYVDIDFFLKNIYEDHFEGCQYVDIPEHVRKKVAITFIVADYLTKKKLLGDDLDDFEKDLLMETSVSELKLIEKKVFMNNTSRENHNSVNNKNNILSLIYAVIFTFMSWFFISITINDNNSSIFEVLPFYLLFIGGAVCNFWVFFMKK